MYRVRNSFSNDTCKIYLVFFAYLGGLKKVDVCIYQESLNPPDYQVIYSYCCLLTEGIAVPV